MDYNPLQKKKNQKTTLAGKPLMTFFTIPQWVLCHRPSSYSATLQIRWNAWDEWWIMRVRNSWLDAETPKARKRKKKQDWNSMNNKGWLIIHYKRTSPALLGWGSYKTSNKRNKTTSTDSGATKATASTGRKPAGTAAKHRRNENT